MIRQKKKKDTILEIVSVPKIEAVSIIDNSTFKIALRIAMSLST